MEERDLAMKARLKEMENLCDSLYEDFCYKANVAHKKGEREECRYWMDRAGDMSRIFSALRDDQNKLEEWSYEK